MPPLRSAWGSWPGLLKQRLYPYRPRLRDWRFWAVQGLVVVVAVVHGAVEMARLAGATPVDLTSLSFVPVSFFFIPVVYAALNFGFAGSLATALWCTVLAIPNVFVFHQGLERLGELFQLGIFNAVAVFVGQRVDRETRARTLLQTTTARYRSLFESSPAAILVLSATGQVLEANPAAGRLFGRRSELLRGAGLEELVGPAGRGLLDLGSPRRQEPELVLERPDGSRVYLEPTSTRIPEAEGEGIVQTLLRNVTEERRQRVELRAYAAHILRAQEDERKRIAQELHDVSVQELVLLCRQLDSVEYARRSSSQEVASELREARRTAEGLVESLRGFARALRPPTLEDLGLVTAIQKLLSDLDGRDGIRGQLRVQGEERRLAPEAELSLYRIAQEALRNVEYHARASRVVVTLAFDPEAVRLTVADDGVGFEPNGGGRNPGQQDHLGLVGMQERAQLVGGELVLESSPGRGTRVEVTLPA